MINLIWIADPASILSQKDIPSAFKLLKDNGYKEIGLAIGAWDKTGTLLTRYPVNDIKSFCVQANTAGMIVYLCAYADNGGTYTPVVSDSTVRTKMINNVISSLAYGGDGWIDDSEGWSGSNIDITTYWNDMAVACHKINKIGAVYYGLKDYPSGLIENQTILSNITKPDFVCIRFFPLSPVVDTLYDTIIKYCTIPWSIQIRALSSNNEKENPQSFIDYSNKKWNNGVVPKGYRGATFWEHVLGTPNEFLVLKSWFKTFGGEIIMVNKTFSGKLSAVDVGANISNVVVTIAVTGGVTDTLTTTTDSSGNYTINKDYPLTATINASAIASVNADATSASASSIATAFQIVFSLLKRTLTLVMS